MSTIVHSGRQQRLFVAATVCLLLATSSCAPDLTPPVATKQGDLPSTVFEPSALSDLPTEPVKSSAVESAENSTVSPGTSLPAELAMGVDMQETPGSAETRVDKPVEPAPIPPSKKTPHVAKEDAMDQPTCSESTSDEGIVSRFFPLSNGASWHYQLKVLDSSGETLSEATVERRVEGTKSIGGKDYIRLTTTTLSGTDTRAPDQHYRVTDDGVVAAVEGVSGKELLVLPNDPGSKRSWSGEAPPIIKSVSAAVTVGERVACGEGVITGCVRVDLDFVMRGAGLFAPREVPVRIERWFASGIGMVRERRIAGGRTIEAVLEKRQL